MLRPRLADAIGLVLLGVAGWATAFGVEAPINMYDEGILLTHSRLMEAGGLPHRDFYSNYPPGIYLVVLAIWKWTGLSPWPVRWLGFGIHALTALLAGRLAARALGRTFCPLAASLVLLWLVPLDVLPFAWLTALAVTLVALEIGLLAHARRSGAVDFASGVALLSVSCFRHDLFVYLVLALAAVALVLRPPLPTVRRALAFAAGAAVPLLLVWLPLLAGAGWQAVSNDLFFDQIRYVNPARWLPLPPLVAFEGVLPAFLASPLSGAVALSLVGPGAALVAFVASRRLGLSTRVPIVLLGALATAVLPQMLLRTDLFHAVFAAAPAAALCGVLVEAVADRLRTAAARAGVLTLGVLSLAAPVLPTLSALPFRWPTLPVGPPPYRGVPAAEDRLAALSFVYLHTRPGEPIYVGRVSHRRVYTNEVDFYFFANRPGSTRYLQFDPGTVTREDVQREMILQIEAKGTRLAVLSTCCVADEPNASKDLGAPVLDNYLAERFGPVARYGRYVILWRRDAEKDAGT